MSVIRVALPVLEGRRRFHYDKGRPWTVLEHLLLLALSERDSTAAHLATAAGGIPQRVVVEALIRLMRAGWLEMVQRSDGLIFRITGTGLAAARAETLPSATKRLSRRMNFVVEQISGGVFRTRELPHLGKRAVEERSAQEIIVWLDRPSRQLHDEVRPMMDALFFEDETFIGMDPTGDRLVDRWALVTVKDGVAEGLPARASELLKREIERAAAEAPDTPRAGVAVRPMPAPALSTEAVPPTRRFLFSSHDLILGGPAHQEILTSMINRARHRIIIHSTFIDQSRFEALLPALKQSMSRGATVDVLWGQDENAQGVKTTRAVVGRLQTLIAAGNFDRLRLHPFSTGSHAKLLVADDGDPNRFVGVIGSCNWLYSGFDSFEASVRVREPCLVSDLLDQLTEMSRGANGAWLPLTSDLAALAVRQRARPSGSPGKSEARILLASEHAAIVRKAMNEATSRIFVASHRWSHAGHNFTLAPLLAAAAASDTVDITAFYGRPSGALSGDDAAAATLEASKAGVAIRPVRKPRLHAKILAWDDDTVLITSQNLLSADPPDSKPRQEIGILIRAAGAARILIERFNSAKIE